MSSGVCGGERVAAQLEQDGFKTGKAFPCVYVNEQRQVLTIVHGDDHLRTGPVESLRLLDERKNSWTSSRSRQNIGEAQGPEEGGQRAE